MKTLLATLIATLLSAPAAFAAQSEASPVVQTETTTLPVKRKEQREQQRQAFLLIESFAKGVSEAKPISEPLAKRVAGLFEQMGDYPLKMEAEWAWLNAQSASKTATQAEVQAFLQRYPDGFYQKAAEQLAFSLFSLPNDREALLAYAEKIKPTSRENQCRHLLAQYQQLLAKSADNQLAKEALFVEKTQFWTAFEQFWLADNQTMLPADCSGIFTAWQAETPDFTAKLKAKGLVAFKANRLAVLESLKESLNSQQPATSDPNPDLAWFDTAISLLKQPANLAKLLQQPVQLEYKPLILQTFPAWLKTLPEQSKPDFAPYQSWAEQYQLSESELNSWKISFLNRFFENEANEFQQWRDAQLLSLQNEALFERRVRLALRQNAPIADWLAQLPDATKQKAEWRYWLAKVETNKAKQQAAWEALSQERGFYPMLAAHQLGKSYRFNEPVITPLTEAQKSNFSANFHRLEELISLQRHDYTKRFLGFWLKNLTKDEQLGVINELHQRQWYELAVEGTIVAKAFDYLSLRLPNAYADWFALNLADKPISQSFAMAIARQESAWNPQARSHANAIGLMQMLPATAQQTASQSLLPYAGEKDLLDPFKNIMLGTAHLAELNAKYPNNRILIAAAYNAGSGRVSNWLARTAGKLDFDAFIAAIPFGETRGYVQNVLAYDYYHQILQKQPNPRLFTAEEIQLRY